MNITEQEQLELIQAGNQQPPIRTAAKAGKQNRAEWWFKQMRQVVDKALDWQPAPRFRPEQIWFNDTIRRN